MPTTTAACPDIEDECIYNEHSTETRSKYQCQGEAEAELSVHAGWLNVDNYHFPLDRNFGYEDYSDAEVIACCGDDYADGCNDHPPTSPHGLDCVRDCAMQACPKLNKQYLQYIYSDLDLPTLPIAHFTEALKLVTHLEDHVSECRDAILKQYKCEDVWGPGNCDGVFRRKGIYEVPNNAEHWPHLTNITIQIRCEITDWHLDPNEGPAEECNGAHGNNADPFPDPPAPPDEPVITFLVDSLEGDFETEVDATPVTSSFDGEDILFRQPASCPSPPCAFRLDKLNLTAASINLGDLEFVDVEAVMTTTADGTISGTTATFPPHSVMLTVSGVVESTAYPLLDDLRFAWIAANDGDVTLDVTPPSSLTPTFEITSGPFTVGLEFDPSAPIQFSLTSDPAGYTAAP